MKVWRKTNELVIWKIKRSHALVICKQRRPGNSFLKYEGVMSANYVITEKAHAFSKSIKCVYSRMNAMEACLGKVLLCLRSINSNSDLARGVVNFKLRSSSRYESIFRSDKP